MIFRDLMILILRAMNSAYSGSVGEVGLDAGKETSLLEKGDDIREWGGGIRKGV